MLVLEKAASVAGRSIPGDRESGTGALPPPRHFRQGKIRGGKWVPQTG
jgi:hypothetical protein